MLSCIQSDVCKSCVLALSQSAFGLVVARAVRSSQQALELCFGQLAFHSFLAKLLVTYAARVIGLAVAGIRGFHLVAIRELKALLAL